MNKSKLLKTALLCLLAVVLIFAVIYASAWINAKTTSRYLVIAINGDSMRVMNLDGSKDKGRKRALPFCTTERGDVINGWGMVVNEEANSDDVGLESNEDTLIADSFNTG